MQNTEVLHSMQELFTIVSTGESGVSLRGLFRLSGIDVSTLSKWFKFDLLTERLPKELHPLQGKPLYLLTESPIKVRGKAIKPIRSNIAWAVIEYAAFDLLKPEARQTLKNSGSIGFESWIQGATGYLPEQYQASTIDARYEITRLVREPNPWKRLYSARTCEKIRSWYFPRDFFWKFAYAWMTPEEIAFLNEHNPVIEGIWQRRDRIFQMLSQETRDRLAPEIAALCTLVESSTSRSDFETRWMRIHGNDQQEIGYA
jgi:hypothetical protein